MANVTPGYTFTGTSDPITYTKLNLLAQPTVTVGANELTLANLPTASANNTFIARYTTGSGNYQALVTTTTGLGFFTGAGGTGAGLAGGGMAAPVLEGACALGGSVLAS